MASPFVGRIFLAVFVVTFPVLVGFSGWKLLQQMSIKHQRAAAAEQEFQAWVTWRGEHCRLRGMLTRGQFVCDNGLVFPARADRWGEWRTYPDFIREEARNSVAKKPESRVEPASP
mgnify:CR=1 FL=1